MTIHDGTTGAAARGLPALLIVDADAQARAATEAALARRFGADYRVLTADAPQAGLDILEGWRAVASRWRWWRRTCTCRAWTAWSSRLRP